MLLGYCPKKTQKHPTGRQSFCKGMHPIQLSSHWDISPRLFSFCTPGPLKLALNLPEKYYLKSPVKTVLVVTSARHILLIQGNCVSMNRVNLQHKQYTRHQNLRLSLYPYHVTRRSCSIQLCMWNSIFLNCQEKQYHCTSRHS